MPAPRQIALIAAILGLATVPTVAVVALVLSAQVATTPSGRPPRLLAPAVDGLTSPSSAASPAGSCQATVGGRTAAAVETAVANAGAGTVCFPAGLYEGSFAATAAGQTWRLHAEAVLAGPVTITAPDVSIRGGTLELPTDNQWAEGIAVDADRATIEGVTFRGGGLVVSVKGRDGTQILDNDFSGQSGTAIFIWGEGRGADDTLIRGNTIDQAAARMASPISSRAADDPAEGIVNRRITIRGNTIDQGDAATGWFGVELKLSPDAVIVDNNIRGGAVLISLPDSDGSIVSGNRLDLRGSAWWGVEIASSDDVTVTANTFIGDGPSSGDAAVSMNSGSLRALVSANRAEGLRTLVNLTGNDHRIVDNCLVEVRDVVAYRLSAGADVDVIRNGPCR